MRPIRAVLEDFVPICEQHRIAKREILAYVDHYVLRIDQLASELMAVQKQLAERDVSGDYHKQPGVDFDHLLQLVHGLPMTWYPSLLLEVVRASYEAGTWMAHHPFAVSNFIREHEAQWKEAKELADD